MIIFVVGIVAYRSCPGRVGLKVSVSLDLTLNFLGALIKLDANSDDL